MKWNLSNSDADCQSIWKGQKNKSTTVRSASKLNWLISHTEYKHYSNIPKTAMAWVKSLWRLQSSLVHWTRRSNMLYTFHIMEMSFWNSTFTIQLFFIWTGVLGKTKYKSGNGMRQPQVCASKWLCVRFMWHCCSLCGSVSPPLSNTKPNQWSSEICFLCPILCSVSWAPCLCFKMAQLHGSGACSL